MKEIVLGSFKVFVYTFVENDESTSGVDIAFGLNLGVFRIQWDNGIVFNKSESVLSLHLNLHLQKRRIRHISNILSEEYMYIS